MFAKPVPAGPSVLRQQPLAGLHTCSGATSPGLSLKQNADAASTALGFAHTALPWGGTPVGQEAETSQSPPSPRGQTAPGKHVVKATGLLFPRCVGQTLLLGSEAGAGFNTPGEWGDSRASRGQRPDSQVAH